LNAHAWVVVVADSAIDVRAGDVGSVSDGGDTSSNKKNIPDTKYFNSAFPRYVGIASVVPQTRRNCTMSMKFVMFRRE
jgi:hypothetical protein